MYPIIQNIESKLKGANNTFPLSSNGPYLTYRSRDMNHVGIINVGPNEVYAYKCYIYIKY